MSAGVWLQLQNKDRINRVALYYKRRPKRHIIGSFFTSTFWLHPWQHNSGVQIISGNDEIVQLFVKCNLIFFKHVNGMRFDIFNKIYCLPSLLQAFSLTRFYMDSTKFEHISASSSSCYQTLITALIIFCIVEQSSFWSLCLIIAHRFSIGFMLREIPGHSSTVNLLSS